MACLEDLIPDIHFLMLVTAPSVQSLWGFIRSSPRMFKVFCVHRNVILSSVIARDIGHEILGNVYCALNTSRIPYRGPLTIPEVQEWIITHRAELDNRISRLRIPLGSDALPLWRIHRYVKFLANVCVHERLPPVTDIFEVSKMIKSQYENDDYSLPDLSHTEMVRVFRGIYRFVIFGNLFFCDKDKPWDKRRKPLCSDEFDYLDLFSIMFPTLQLENRSCINDYRCEQIADKWTKMEKTSSETLARDLASCDFDCSPHHSRWEFDFVSHSMKHCCNTGWQRYYTTLPISDLRAVFVAEENCSIAACTELLDSNL